MVKSVKLIDGLIGVKFHSKFFFDWVSNKTTLSRKIAPGRSEFRNIFMSKRCASQNFEKFFVTLLSLRSGVGTKN